MVQMTDILFEYDHIMMRAKYRIPDLHRHLASHLAVGLGGMLHCSVGGEEFDAEGIVIASDAEHTIYADGDILLCLFDATSVLSMELDRRFLQGEDCRILKKELVHEMRKIWDKNDGNLERTDSDFLTLLVLQKANGGGDARIREALKYLRELETVPDRITDLLCQRACLSKSRFSHLFKEQMGISLHRYLALDKMKKGFVYYMECGNITDAAMRAGFDSPSHFAATCKRMFGISFSEFARSIE